MANKKAMPTAQRDSVFDEFVRQFSPTSRTAPSSEPAIRAAPERSPAAYTTTFAPPNPPPVRAEATKPPSKPSRLAGVEPIFLNLDDAAAVLAISVATLQRLVREGAVPKPKVISVRRVAWLLTDLQVYAASRRDSDLQCPPNTGWPRKPRQPGPTNIALKANETRPRSWSAESDSAMAPPGGISAWWASLGQPAQEQSAPLPRLRKRNERSTYVSGAGSRRDHTGELSKLGSVYRIPGTDIVWLKLADAGALRKPFAIAIQKEGRTWAEMELTGAERETAIQRIKASS